MNVVSWMRMGLFSTLTITGLALVGCGRGSKEADKSVTPTSDASCAVAENWCIEHGVPEDLCGQCNAKVAADCQKKGDWCKEHSRPESQCFLCHPELKAKFIAEYEAKCGKNPPQPNGKPS